MPCNSTCPSQGPNSAAWARHRSDATLRAMSTMLLQANPPSHPALWADGGSSDTHALDILNRCIFLIGFRELEQSPFFPPHTTSSNLLDQKTSFLNGDRYSPKSRNCFMESGEGENLEKCSMCLGTLAKAAFFMMNLTNFIIAVEGPGSCLWPQRRMWNLLSCRWHNTGGGTSGKAASSSQ